MSDEAIEIIVSSDKIAEQARLTADNITVLTEEAISHDILVFLFCLTLALLICCKPISTMARLILT